MALVQLSVVEKRLDAVRAVLAGARVGEVAASLGVSRQSVHAWMVRYLAGGGRWDGGSVASAAVEPAAGCRCGRGRRRGDAAAASAVGRETDPAAAVPLARSGRLDMQGLADVP